MAGNHADLNESLIGLNITDGPSHDNMMGLFHSIFAVCPKIKKNNLEQCPFDLNVLLLPFILSSHRDLLVPVQSARPSGNLLGPLTLLHRFQYQHLRQQRG